MKVPPLKEDANVDQDSVNPPPLTDGYIRASLIQLSQAATIQVQDMTAQSNQEISPRPHQQVTTHYYGFPSKGLHSNEPSYFLWV